MRAVVLGDVERTTNFFDRILDTYWIDFDDIDDRGQINQPDIVFICWVSQEIKMQVRQFSRSLICVLWDAKQDLVGADIHISLSTPTVQVIEMIKSAAKSKLKNSQSWVTYSYNQCHLKDMTLTFPWWTIELTDIEGLILWMLLEHPWKLLKRETILNTLGDRTDTSLKKLDVFIYHLRQKVQQTQWLLEIETIQGMWFAIKTPLSLVRDNSEKSEYGGIVFLKDRGQVFFWDQLLNQTHLTQSEWEVFQMIFRWKWKRYNQERILHEISDEIETNQEWKKIVDVYISHIRRKLWIWRDLVSTEFWDGYALDVPGFKKQTEIEKEKTLLYTRTPRIFTTQLFEFWELIDLLCEEKYRGNYTLYVSTQQDEKKIVLKIVQSSHPDRTHVYQASGNIYTPEEKLNPREASRRFDKYICTPVEKSQYLAFNQDTEDALLSKCPWNVWGLENLDEIIHILKLPENVGAYIYYARIHSNVDWPRTYIAIERIPDHDTPLIISVAVLENRMRKRIKYMSIDDVLERYGSRRISKIATTSIFQNQSRELSGKTTRTECPPNLVNGVRSISEITSAFTNPAYFWEYIYSWIIDSPRIDIWGESVWNPHLVIMRKWNELNIKIIGGVYYSGEWRTRREVKVVRLEVEHLKTLWALKVKKCIFDANLKRQWSLKWISLKRELVVAQEGEKVTVQKEISLQEFESVFTGNTIPSEYKTLTMKWSTGEKNILAFMSTQWDIQFTVQDGGGFSIISFAELCTQIQYNKYTLLKKEVLVVVEDEKGILEVLEWYKNEIYREWVYRMRYRSRNYICSIVKKNGKIVFILKDEELTLQEFLQKYGERTRFSLLKKI